MSAAPDVELEIERLRAERDALAAELQIERAERLRVEERLRLFERERLEQMREGAASRERLASELEEARLRAMRAEARQAALDADLRLSEIAERRRGRAGADGERDALAAEIAEAEVDAPTVSDEPEPEPAPEGSRRQRLDPTAPMGRSTSSKYSRLSRGDSASSRESVARPPSARPSAGPDPNAGSSSGRLRMSDVSEPRWPSQGTASTPSGDDRADAARTPPAPPPSRNGASSTSRNGGGARGGAAAGRPSIDRAQLEMRLAAGQIIETTDRFSQFQPVAQPHIKICDLLSRARTLDDLDALAAGEVARSEIVSILTLFFERSFLVFK